MIYCIVPKSKGEAAFRPSFGLKSALNIPEKQWHFQHRSTAARIRETGRLRTALLEENDKAFNVEDHGKCWLVQLRQQS